MSPGTGVDPGTSKTGRRLSPSALPFFSWAIQQFILVS